MNCGMPRLGADRGRSTAEPLFIVRRLQELVEAKKGQALHLIFLDWEKPLRGSTRGAWGWSYEGTESLKR